jgi:hypothetical protein
MLNQGTLNGGSTVVYINQVGICICFGSCRCVMAILLNPFTSDRHVNAHTQVTYFTVSLRGRAIAQAVSHWLPTVAAQVQAWVWSCGICDGQNGAGAGFLRVLRFPLPICIPPTAPQSPPSVIWGWYNRPVVAAVPSGLSLLQCHLAGNKRMNLKYQCKNPKVYIVTFLLVYFLTIWT